LRRLGGEGLRINQKLARCSHSQAGNKLSSSHHVNSTQSLGSREAVIEMELESK